jgi:hypothetical protein
MVDIAFARAMVTAPATSAYLSGMTRVVRSGQVIRMMAGESVGWTSSTVIVSLTHTGLWASVVIWSLGFQLLVSWDLRPGQCFDHLVGPLTG